MTKLLQQHLFDEIFQNEHFGLVPGVQWYRMHARTMQGANLCLLSPIQHLNSNWIINHPSRDAKESMFEAKKGLGMPEAVPTGCRIRIDMALSRTGSPPYWSVVFD